MEKANTALAERMAKREMYEVAHDAKINAWWDSQVKLNEISRDNYEKVLKDLDHDEEAIFGSVIDEKGSIFQSALVEKTGMTKVKVTRLLDKLEGKGLIERKRRGMTNIVVIKH